MSTLCYSLWLSFHRIGSHTVHPTTWPLIWLGFNAFMLCNPLPVYHRSSRVWLIKQFARLLITGLKRVGVRIRYASPEFARTHVILVLRILVGVRPPSASPVHTLFTLTVRIGHPHRDQICSLNYSLTNLYFIGCFYHSGFGPDWNQQCGTKGTHLAPHIILSVSPFFCRFIQSLRRWYDSRSTTHLINVSNPYFLNITIDLPPHPLGRPENTSQECSCTGSIITGDSRGTRGTRPLCCTFFLL